jgi:hypothetical protein
MADAQDLAETGIAVLRDGIPRPLHAAERRFRGTTQMSILPWANRL